VSATGAGPLLSVRDLVVEFPGARGAAAGSSVRPVDRVSFDIAAGEVLALVGESGSGKSMTALAIMGLLTRPGRIASGTVAFAGNSLHDRDEAGMREIRGAHIGMIFQEPMSSLNPLMTIGDQVAEPLRAHRGLSRSAALEQAIGLLRMVEIPSPRERLRDYPHQFSGGMRQRVMIAIALACEPRLLIADEPTTALDVTIQDQILGLIRRLQQQLGLSVLLITHDLGVVAQAADRALVMYGGRIVEEAPVEALFAQPAHPYTRALLASMPSLEARSAHLHTIDGQVPALDAMPPGCRFAPRCPHRIERCDRTLPELLEVFAPGRDHRAACIRVDDLLSDGTALAGAASGSSG
jgi:oligopeptide/dipeptide ABC transporter ATP-binding protein